MYALIVDNFFHNGECVFLSGDDNCKGRAATALTVSSRSVPERSTNNSSGRIYVFCFLLYSSSV